mmetsp:Transcript_32067/g.42289  ORF Transcript_32067/g.42289 Transcript_32067/m.42289 type:complete len:465 (+) Transcript_32067:314-1708(+)
MNKIRVNTADSEDITHQYPRTSVFCGINSKYFLLCYAFFQNVSGAGLIFGWAAISGTLLVDTNSGPGLSDSDTHLIFTASCCISFISPFFLGILLDWVGPRVCNTLAQLMISGGLVLFGLSDKNFNYFLPAMCLVAAGGPGVQCSVIHLSNLFPRSKSSITAVITGAFALSFTVFLIFNEMWRAGAGYQQIFIGYSWYSMIYVVLSLIIWPDRPFSDEDALAEIIETDGETTDDEDDTLKKIKMPEVFDITTLNISLAPPTPTLSEYTGRRIPRSNKEKRRLRRIIRAKARKNLKQRSFWRQLRSGPFIRLSLLFIPCTFWANTYIGTLGVMLGDQSFIPVSKQDPAAALLTELMTAGTLCTPVAGYLMDRAGFPLTAIFILLNSIIWAAAQLFETTSALYVGFVAYSIFRTMLFTYYFAKLADSLGFRFFGVLSGTTFFLCWCHCFAAVSIIRIRIWRLPYNT